MSVKTAREVIRDWKNTKYEEYWQSFHGQRQAKRALEQFILSRNKPSIMMVLLTEHCI
jgi:hypothetical protein